LESIKVTNAMEEPRREYSNESKREEENYKKRVEDVVRGNKEEYVKTADQNVPNANYDVNKVKTNTYHQVGLSPTGCGSVGIGRGLDLFHSLEFAEKPSLPLNMLFESAENVAALSTIGRYQLA